MKKIDDSLYSRQRPVFGDGAMHKLADSKILVYGLGGVGIEIAKNLVLCGIKELLIQDPQVCSITDLGTQFFVRQPDVDAQKTRAEASLPRLSALNPYVRVAVAPGDLSLVLGHDLVEKNSAKAVEVLQPLLAGSGDGVWDNRVQCLVVTQGSLEMCTTLNLFCRLHQICFICVNTYGVLGNLFCDFGSEFVVSNATGEHPKEFFIGHLEPHSHNEVLVTVFNDRQHQLEDGDCIRISEVCGMTQLNNSMFPVKVHSSTKLLITVETPTDQLPAYEGGGIAIQIVQPKTCSFEPLLSQLQRPSIVTCDLSCPEEGPLLHLIYVTLKKFEKEEGRLPKPWDKDDWELCRIKLLLLHNLLPEKVQFDESLALRLLSVSRGQLPPLCAFFGGVAAQEAIKAVSGVFMPYNQWLYMHCDAVVPRDIVHLTKEISLDEISSRYHDLCVCVGQECLRRLHRMSSFMVGCGAIGCELLKNLALIGLATGGGEGSDAGDHLPCLTITDHDHIEKSNLNRQFLFGAQHIGQAKSTIAAEVTRQINPDMRISAMREKIWKANERTVFTDSFLVKATSSGGDLEEATPVLAALDCVASRRYLDQRCVTLGLALLESGTLGTKGHVQVVLPHRTESYNSQQDGDSSAGGDESGDSIPYCTLKSFPAKPVHCIEWAREKFASQFTLKPGKLGQIVREAQRAPSDASPGAVPTTTVPVVSPLAVAKSSQLTPSLSQFLLTRPVDWVACVWLGMDKFERYFNHKARHLLHAFPPDAKLSDGKPFWQLPRRQPTPLVFDVMDSLHRQFVLTFACLLADQVDLASRPDLVGDEGDDDEQIRQLTAWLDGYEPPAFVPSSKRIVTDPSAVDHRTDPDQTRSDPAEQVDSSAEILEALARPDHLHAISACHAVSFEKDDDRLAHVDFITAAANLRATMYGLATTPRHEVRRIAGRIVPAISTTTSVVAGLVCLELTKYAANTGPPSSSSKAPDGKLPARNAFLNLALPMVLLSEPMACPSIRLPTGATYTLWDRWEIRASGPLDQYKLSDFIGDIKQRHNLLANIITQGSRLIYADYMPTYKSRQAKPLISLLQYEPDDRHVDLMLAYNGDDDDIVGPPIRFLLV